MSSAVMFTQRAKALIFCTSYLYPEDNTSREYFFFFLCKEGLRSPRIKCQTLFSGNNDNTAVRFRMHHLSSEDFRIEKKSLTVLFTKSFWKKKMGIGSCIVSLYLLTLKVLGKIVADDIHFFF